MKKSKLILIVSVLVLVALIGFKLAANKKKINAKEQVKSNTDKAIPATVQQVAYGSVNENLTKLGTLNAFREADITAETSGRINDLNFELGTRVKEGQLIGALDSHLKELALAQIELTAKKNKEDYERYSSLLASNATTETTVTDMKYQYENSVNQLDQLKKDLADASIKAPISGEVIEKKVEKGKYVSAGTSLGTVVDISKLKVQVPLSEQEVYRIKKGQTVTVTSDVYPDKIYPGMISYISPKGDDSHNYTVEVVLGNDDRFPLKAGSYVSAKFLSGTEEQVMLISRDAIVESLKDPYVYVLENNKAVKREIKAGRELGNSVEVLGGLKPGETVITSGQINLVQGTLVEVVK